MNSSKPSPRHSVLITGCAGYIGKYLLLDLLKNTNLHIYGVDFADALETVVLSTKDYSPERFTPLAVDLKEPSETQKLPSCSLVFHLAAINGTQVFYEKPWTVFSNSLHGTINLITRYSKDPFINNFVYTSSSEVYADLTEFNSNSETTDELAFVGFKDVLNPRWSYGGAKLGGEIALLSAGKELGIPFSILRYHNVYGPGMGPNHVIPDFVARGKKGTFKLFGGANIRSFIFIDDAIRATRLVSEHPLARNRIVHVGNNEPVTMSELARKIMIFMEWNGEVQLESAPEGSVARRCPDISFLVDVLGFKSRIDLDEGIALTLKDEKSASGK